MEHISNNDTLKTTFKKRFDELRGGLSNTEFAKKIGLSRQTVGFFLNGDRLPSAENLVDIAKKCGVSTDYLLGLSDCPAVDDKVKAACEYTHLSAKAVKSLNTFFDPDDTFFLGNVVDLTNSLIESNTLLQLMLSAHRIRNISNEIQNLEKKNVEVSKLGEKLVIEKVCATECLDAFIDKHSDYSLCRNIVNDTRVAAFDDMTQRIEDIIAALESGDE